MIKKLYKEIPSFFNKYPEVVEVEYKDVVYPLNMADQYSDVQTGAVGSFSPQFDKETVSDDELSLRRPGKDVAEVSIITQRIVDDAIQIGEARALAESERLKRQAQKDAVASARDGFIDNLMANPSKSE